MVRMASSDDRPSRGVEGRRDCVRGMVLRSYLVLRSLYFILNSISSKI